MGSLIEDSYADRHNRPDNTSKEQWGGQLPALSEVEGLTRDQAVTDISGSCSRGYGVQGVCCDPWITAMMST